MRGIPEIVAQTPKKRTLRPATLLAALVLVLVALAFTIPQFARRTFKPPGGATSLLELLAQPGFQDGPIFSGRHLDDDYLVVFGDVVWLAAPSGPSCFIFAMNGQLLEYSASSGDGELDGRCDHDAPLKQINREEALAELRR